MSAWRACFTQQAFMAGRGSRQQQLTQPQCWLQVELAEDETEDSAVRRYLKAVVQSGVIDQVCSRRHWRSSNSRQWPHSMRPSLVQQQPYTHRDSLLHAMAAVVCGRLQTHSPWLEHCFANGTSSLQLPHTATVAAGAAWQIGFMLVCQPADG